MACYNKLTPNCFSVTPALTSNDKFFPTLDAIYWNLSDTLMHFTMVNARHMITAFFDSIDISGLIRLGVESAHFTSFQVL